MKVNVLGTLYRIIERSEAEDQRLKDSSGYCDSSTKEIVLDIPADDPMNKGDLEEVKKVVLRHEIIHAFLCESGLDCNSCSVTDWATNEEMVDWIAIQFPKILKAFDEVGAL